VTGNPYNLLEVPPPGQPPEEIIRTLHEHAETGTRIEQITSHGQASPEGFWYDQAQDEWVLLVQGDAELELEGQPMLVLRAGDSLHLPARLKHRVHRTSADAVWVAEHLGRNH
jgi:cupin 2 domain-containing protein